MNEMGSAGDPPGVRRSGAVLVAGPAQAGATSMVARLREQLPGVAFVEASDIARGEAPAVVVFVVSAVAPMVESDCTLADLLTRHTDAVVPVLTKVDDHRRWRHVVAADRELFGRRVPRLAEIPWARAAAAPRLGEPDVDDVVTMLRQQLADPRLTRRNQLRAWQSHVSVAVATLKAERAEVRRGPPLTRADRVAAVRSRVQQDRLELSYAARHACARLRIQLGADVAAATARTLGDVEARIGQRCRETLAGAGADLDERVADLMSEFGGGVAPPRSPCRVTVDRPARARRLETQLMVVLGAGFGFGVALVMARLLASLPTVGTVAGGLAGLVVTVWVVRARCLLHDRAALDRWGNDAIALLRPALEERVSARLLVVEADLVAAVSRAAATDAAVAGRRLAEIDAELRTWASRWQTMSAADAADAVTDR